MIRSLFLSFSLVIFLLFLFSCDNKSRNREININDFESLNSLLASPTKEYRTAPLYVWNTKITQELIDSTMQGLKDNGFGGVFIHPRPGLVTEYISDEWFELFRHTIDKGKELDMNVWIYDENSYPSGFAGGHVPAQMPESYNQGQGLKMVKVDILPDTVSSFYLCLKKEDNEFTDISNNWEKEIGNKGEYYLFEKTYMKKTAWYGGFSYVDLLYPGVTEKFIETTFGGYERIAGDEFGKTMPGWFTDEPGIKPSTGIRWTPDLFEQFKNRWGYDLKDHLPSLFEETGDWKLIRHNYLQTLLDLFIERWAKPSFQYCEEKNICFTGHYWEHVWPNVMHGGDNMAMYAWHHMPGIDLLFNRYNENSSQAHFGNVRAVKELRSAANQTGRQRTLCETYGGGGWNETFKDFKRLGDWEYALGVNFMNQHLSHISISGARKYDYPPTFSEHSPWWPYYKPLNDYFARLSVAMSAGEQLNDILIIEPTTTVWMYYSYNTFRDKKDPIWEIGEAFQSFITILEKNQIEYDLGSENIIENHGKIEKNKFVVGQRAYSKAVIPPLTENINKITFDLLQEFVKNGGTVIAYSKPEYMDGSLNSDIKTFFTANDNIVHLKYSKPLELERYISPEIQFNITNGNSLFHQRRKMEDGQILFLVNSSIEEQLKGQIVMDGKDVVELNCMTGKAMEYQKREKDAQIEFDITLPPAGSLLLYVFNKKQNGFDKKLPGNNYIAINSVDSITVQPDDLNVLTIDFCDLKLGKNSYQDMHIFDAGDAVFKYYGFVDGNPWNTSVQYKDNIVRRDTFSTGGFEVRYKFYIEDDFDYSDMQAVVERAYLYDISLNEKEIKVEKDKWWLDRDMNLFLIGDKVKKGMNILTVKLSPMSIYAEIEPIYIRGKFNLESINKGWKIVSSRENLSIGSWKVQGWPFYAGGVFYKKNYNLDNTNRNYRVYIDKWEGTVCEVVVNNKSAGIIFSEPYELDVTDFILKGKNSMEIKVIGSNKNLLGPFHNNPPMGVVSPRNFRNVQKYPAGNEYHQLDYGLMGDFILKERIND